MSSFPNVCGGSGSGSGKGGGFYLIPNPPEEGKNLFTAATEAEAEAKMIAYFTPNKLQPYDADTMRIVLLHFQVGGQEAIGCRNRVYGHWVDTFNQAITATDLSTHSINELSDGAEIQNKLTSAYEMTRHNYTDILNLQTTQWTSDASNPSTYQLKVPNANISVAGSLLLSTNPVTPTSIPTGMFDFSAAIKDAEVTYDNTSKKLAINCEKFSQHFKSNDGSITINHEDDSTGCKINLQANLPEGSIKASKDGTTYSNITKIHVSNDYAVIQDNTLHLPVISAEGSDGLSLGPIKNIRAGKGITFSDTDGNISISGTTNLQAKSEYSEDTEQHEYKEFTKIDIHNPSSSIIDGVLTLGGLKGLNRDGNIILSDTGGYVNELKAGSGITFTDAGTHGQLVVSASSGSIRATAGTDTSIKKVTKIRADNAIFEDSNNTLRIKGISGTVGGNSDTIKQIEVIGTTTGSSVSNGKLTINIPNSGSASSNTIAVTGKDFDAEGSPEVSQISPKLNFGNTMDLNVETQDGQSYVTVNTRGLQLQDKDGNLLGKNIQELVIEGGTITQEDPKNGKAKLTIDTYKPPEGIPKNCYSVLTTINDFTLSNVETGNHTIHYQLVQDPGANLRLDNNGGLKVGITARYDIEVGLQLIGQNDWVGHSGTFHIELQERTHEASDYATKVVAEGDVSAGGTGEFHGKYPLIRAKFESIQLQNTYSYRIVLTTSGLSSNMGQATLDPYKNYLSIDPSNGNGTGAMIAHTYRNTLGGLSFNVGYEVRVESVTDQTASPRVYGERYNAAKSDIPVKTLAKES